MASNSITLEVISFVFEIESTCHGYRERLLVENPFQYLVLGTVHSCAKATYL